LFLVCAFEVDTVLEEAAEEIVAVCRTSDSGVIFPRSCNQRKISKNICEILMDVKLIF